jgi:protein TonB
MEVREMFGDTLLESSSSSRKGKRWPMATAFTVEAIVAAIVVTVPLLSTGVLPVSAHMICPVPVKPVTLEPIERVRTEHAPASGPATAAPRPAVVLVSDNPNAIPWGHATATTTDPREATPPGYTGGSGSLPSDLVGPGGKPNGDFGGPKRIVSTMTEAQLINKVEPVYPHIATVSGIQGQVKLHAIIARDGTIQSLNVISGHPLLARAALEAVEQWRYRPYVLNGEKVEVETFITVNFRRDAH